MRSLITFLLFPFYLIAAQIQTFYGPVEVEEPVILELIESPSFQRLKLIHQYGVSYYTTHREEYTRYDHSLGVFAVLRAHHASLEEQIAGLLHDVSHTVFSHVGDWIFKMNGSQDKDYQNSIHERFLKESGLAAILKKYRFKPSRLLPLEEAFPALEQKLPNLCADRIDYNIQGAYYQKFITYEEALEIFEDIQFIEGRWVSTKPELMAKISRFSLFMTQDCWGNPDNHFRSRWLADAILRGIDLGYFSYDTIHFGTDEIVWNCLKESDDPEIQKKMQMIVNVNDYFCLAEPSQADLIIESRFRGPNPWIMSDGEIVRLTDVDQFFAQEYHRVKEKIEKGWPVKLNFEKLP